MIDGARRPSVTESDLRFRCDETETRLRFRQERRELEQVAEDMDRAFDVEMLSLEMSGRRIEPLGLEQLRARFHGFAWVETVDLRCDRDAITLLIRAMPRNAWVESFRSRGPWVRPSSISVSVEVFPNGNVSIE